FGLSEKTKIDALAPYSDIMVVGSALIKEYADKSLEDALKSVKEFMHELI
ncbi:MAG: tryptophan synthase subunit alpha, partial [Candidatus Marinimicrobia bacterium]|nr:tryptophan synthase subunit alpha [Candidatus Neomarinimicrobiota bacterium]